MDLMNLTTSLALLQSALDTADVHRPDARIKIDADGLSLVRLVLEYSNVPEYGQGYETFTRQYTTYDRDEGVDLNEWMQTAFDEAHKWVEQIPTSEERAHQAFTKALGRVIDKGRDIGIEVDFLNPLTQMMERLATNALEDKRNSVE